MTLFVAVVVATWAITRARAARRLGSAMSCPGVDQVDLWGLAKVAGLATALMVAVYFAFSFSVAERYQSIDDAVVKGAIMDTFIAFGEAHAA